MKLETESSFKPITLTLETKEEAEAVWEAVATMSVEGHRDLKRDALVALDVMFCNLNNTGKTDLVR
jgi:hypothetical protein